MVIAVLAIDFAAIAQSHSHPLALLATSVACATILLLPVMLALLILARDA